MFKGGSQGRFARLSLGHKHCEDYKISGLGTNFLSCHKLKDFEVPKPRAFLIQTLQGALVARNKTWLTSIRSQHKTLNDRQVE